MAVFRLRFKQIHKFVKGVLFVFALFNLQGTAVRFAANLDMLPQRKPFVKMFFHLFWVFPVVCGPSSRFLTPFIRQLAYYNAPGINCQALFSLFSIYFFHPPQRSNVHIRRTFPERNTQIFEESMARQIGVCRAVPKITCHCEPVRTLVWQSPG